MLFRSRISIHALREEGDADGGIWKLEAKKFLSTPSARRATRPCTRISTTPSDFYPRPPRGGRLSRSGNELHPTQFLSTPSARRATRDATTIANGMRNFYPRPPRGGRQPSCSAIPRPWNFYPRPPRGGRRLQCLVTWSSHRYFYPRPPRGGRPRSGSCTFQVILFLSTPSARRATPTGWYDWQNSTNFYPRPPRGGRHNCVMGYITIFTISIHALREEGDVLPLSLVP